MSTFVTYDVKKNHAEFKKSLLSQGFYYCISMQSGSKKLLPNTAVIHNDDSASTQIKFKAALAATSPNPELEKVAYVPMASGWSLESDTNCS